MREYFLSLLVRGSKQKENPVRIEQKRIQPDQFVCLFMNSKSKKTDSDINE